MIAIKNDKEYSKLALWKVMHCMTADDINKKYNIDPTNLPLSSRRFYVPSIPEIPKRIISETNFKKLPSKMTKLKDERIKNMKIMITESDLINCCKQSWNDFKPIPVLVLKGKDHWLEWEKIIKRPN